MAIGISLILIAVGAILTWAVTATVSGVDITAVGVILMVVGMLGLVLSLLYMAAWFPPGRTHAHPVDERDPGRLT